MADKENAEVAEKTLNGEDSQSTQNSSSEMGKPWIKTFGKEFYGNKYLVKFDSMQDFAKDYIRMMDEKEVPAEYGYGDEDSKYKDAGLTKAQADKVHELLKGSGAPSKSHEEVFGNDYDASEKNYSRAVGTFANDLMDEIKSSGLDRSPAFAKVMARVGKELGPASFNSTTKDGKVTYRDVYAEIRNKGKR